MRILVVVPAVGGIYGGPSVSVLSLAQALGETGMDVDLVTTNANGKSVLDIQTDRWIQKLSYRIRYFPCKGIGDYKLSLGLSSWLFQNIKDYDLVQTNAIFSLPNLPAYFACRFYKIPYVIIPRGMLEPWALSYKAWKKRIYYKLLEQPALQRASAIQMLASSEAEQIQSLKLKPPIVISPNGVHRQDFDALPSPELLYQAFPETKGKHLILFLGRIDPKKGLDLLAQSFGKISTQFPNAHLIAAGPDNVGFLPTAKKYFSDNGCLDSVTFTGMLKGQMKYAALAAAYCYVAPSYSEGFSMSVLEGMAAGLPCIITTGCNFPEAGQKKSAWVTNVDADAIASALQDCLANPEKAKATGERGRQLILDCYTWDSIAENLSNIYQAISVKQPISQYA